MTAIREYRIKKGISQAQLEEARRIAAQRAAADQQQSSIVGVVAVFLITALAVVLGIIGLVG